MPISLIDKIKPANNGSFPMVDAQDVACGNGRLSDYLPVRLTQAEYDALEASGQINPLTPYLIQDEENSETSEDVNSE